MHSSIPVDGNEIAYRFDGPAQAPVVLLSNSLMSDMSMWEAQMPALTGRYRVLRYDTRGHGASGTSPGPYSIAQLAHDALGLLDALGLERVHFVGLSMGGMIGQYLGARHGDRLLSLCLCATASELPPREMWNERIMQAERDGLEVLVDGTLRRWFTPAFHDTHPDVMDVVAAMILGTGVAGYVACASAVRDMQQIGLLASIRVPTRVIAGRDDPACTLAAAETLHAHIAGSDLVVLDAAAHLANIEQPAAFNTALREFLDAR
jgi:3-oxoadipate enol-lactonase